MVGTLRAGLGGLLSLMLLCPVEAFYIPGKASMNAPGLTAPDSLIALLQVGPSGAIKIKSGFHFS